MYTKRVKSLLENAQKTISPPPQRIIWCYGQWEPSYFDMMRTIPGIEFNQGIPDDIEDTAITLLYINFDNNFAM